MLKPALIAIAVASWSAPMVAQTLEKPDCSQANIASTEEKIVKMRDGHNKDTAESEIATAKEMLTKGQIGDCQSALLRASVQTK